MIYICPEQEIKNPLLTQPVEYSGTSLHFPPPNAFRKEFITIAAVQYSDTEVLSKQRMELESFVLSKMQSLKRYWEYCEIVS